VAYTREWKQAGILVITDHSALGWEEEGRDNRESVTASNPPPQRKAETTQCFGAPAPLPRAWGQSHTAVTHQFLFPSSFNSCLVLAKEQ